ncbi:EAL domain-containing protein [Dehalobacter sp. DCM]|uniref:EAL domain-containing protein n=1 Tax=Dehalobacter sp. DCM TaxID=2907827 RepID=UPI003081C481|nr:EAL domain-containing protein [Dehalobacter sp. DCM]
MSEKLLVVSDSPTDRVIIQKILHDSEIITACDSSEVRRHLDENPDIDLIILDITMPNMAGFQILNDLKSDTRYTNTHILILTNYDEPESEVKGLKLGAADYIRKPLNTESLKVRIGIHLKLIRIQQLYEQRMHEHSVTFDALFQQAPIGIAISHAGESLTAGSNNWISINPIFEQITGRTSEEIMELGWEKITHPDDLVADRNNFERLQSGQIRSYAMEKRYIRPDNTMVWVHMIVAPINLSGKHKSSHICLIQDITERKAIERVVNESERSKAVLLDNLPGMMYRCFFDKDWTMQYVSNGCFELTGYSPGRLLYNRDLSYNDLILPKYQNWLWERWEKAVYEHTKLTEEYEIITASGETKWVWEQGQGIYDENGQIVALEGLIIDITDRKNNEIRLKYLNEKNPETGLLNLRSFELIYAENYHLDTESKRAAIMVNLRRFSAINSVYGYRFGVKLIQDIAKCLISLVSEDRLLFHIANDQFVFYMVNYRDKQNLNHFCERIIRTLDTGIAQKTFCFNIGILEIDKYTCDDAENVLKRVMSASKQINDHERFGYCIFSNAMEQKQQREITILNALTETLSKEQDPSLFMVYQPILDFKTNEIAGFEALARYKNDDLGEISPIEFIPIAESSQLMGLLGKRIMRIVFAFAAYISREGYHPIAFYINISAIQLLSETFLSDVNELIRETGVVPRNLTFEITESVFANNYQEINEKLDKLKTMGIKIAIDDFGTGYSSLARQRELNVDCLKIDKYFINKLIHVRTENAITGDIISMAHKLGHWVVAEGVECEKQRQYLMENNCDMMQGYLYSKPLAEQAAIDLLNQSVNHCRIRYKAN